MEKRLSGLESIAGGQVGGIGLPPTFRLPGNHRTRPRVAMRRNLELTLVPRLTTAAYFGIENIYIPRACCSVKRYGSLIYVCPDLNMTLKVECRPVKGHQPSMRMKVRKEVVVDPIGPIDEVVGPIGVVGLLV
jgi:hypothetical protein